VSDTPSQVRRRSPRLAVDVPIEVRFDHGPAVPGRAVDFSREGLFVVTDRVSSRGTVVRVRVETGANERAHAIGFVVRAVASDEDTRTPGHRRGVGILLTEADEAWERFFTEMWSQVRPVVQPS
jgi:hypothetical protein